jgi:hypothetical protein
MEIVIIVAIWSVMVKRGVEDLIHAARGNTPHRYTAARKSGSTGAWGRYWRTLSDDTAADLLDRHNAKRAQRDIHASRPEEATGPMRAVLRDAWGDCVRYARATWRHGWDKVAQRQQRRRLRPRPGQQTVPGTVVPNQDERHDRPQDGGQDESRPEPRIVQDEDGTTDLKFGDDPTDPTGTKGCPECGGTLITQDGVCLSCRDRQEQRNQHHEDQERPVPDLSHLTPGAQAYERWNQRKIDELTASRNTTQEGPTTMTATTTEVTGLSQTIRFCEDSAAAFRAQAQATEQTVAAVAAGDVSGPAAAKLSHAMELSLAAAEAMDEAAAEFRPQLSIQEQYNANPGAGTREFVTAGQ